MSNGTIKGIQVIFYTNVLSKPTIELTIETLKDMSHSEALT